MLRIVLAVLLVGSGCMIAGVRVSYSSPARFAARPAGCAIDVFRTKQPERPYDEIAGLHFAGSNFARPQGAEDGMREKACAVGADALIVTRDFIVSAQGSLMTTTAIRYRDRTLEAGADAPRSRPSTVPSGWVPATLVAAASLRSAPDRSAGALQDVAAGTAVWASPEPQRGFRRVRTSDGRSGYVEEGLLAIGRGTPDAPPGAAPGAPGDGSAAKPAGVN